MTVYYESLCPDCVDFFKEQFSKNWKPFFDYLNVTLVPYGKASVIVKFLFKNSIFKTYLVGRPKKLFTLW